MTPARPLELAMLRATELSDGITSRFMPGSISAARLVRQAVRVLRAHRIDRFDGSPWYPGYVIIEIAATAVDAHPQLFDQAGCRAIADRIADRIMMCQGHESTVTVAFERQPALARGFRVACDSVDPACLIDRSESGPAPAEAPHRARPPASASQQNVTRLANSTEPGVVLDHLWAQLDLLGDPLHLAERSGLHRDAVERSRQVRQALTGPNKGSVSSRELLTAIGAARRLTRQLGDVDTQECSPYSSAISSMSADTSCSKPK